MQDQEKQDGQSVAEAVPAQAVPGHIQEMLAILENQAEYLDPCPVPPMLERAIGYHGTARLVGFYWEPAGDEASYNDGQIEVCGANWQNYLAYRDHPVVATFLRGYNFGSSDDRATHILIIDRDARPRPDDLMREFEGNGEIVRRAYAAEMGPGRRLLRLQHGPIKPMPRLTEQEYNAFHSDIIDLFAAPMTAVNHSPEEVKAIWEAMTQQILQERQLGHDMQLWLMSFTHALKAKVQQIRDQAAQVKKEKTDGSHAE